MNIDNIKDILHKLTPIVIATIVALFCNYCIDKCISYNKSKLEDEYKLDSITIINSNNKKRVKQLDSIKDVKINEVKKLDNDSTVRLFYKLIRE